MIELPKCDFKFGDVVVVQPSAKYAADFPEVFVITGIDWHPNRKWLVPVDKVNITVVPADSLTDGGTDGFTPDDLRKAEPSEIANNRRH